MIHSDSGAPADYAELFEHYFDFVKALVARAGIRDEEVYDVAMEIITTFMAKGALGWYDPEKEFDTPRGRKTARFASFLRGFVNLYVRQWRDKQITRDYKEPIRCEQPQGNTDEGDPLTWIDLFGGTELPDTTPEFWDWVEQAADHLSELEVRGCRDLAKVFQMVVEQVSLDGSVNRKEIAKAFGVSDTTVCHMFDDLRKELETMGWKSLAITA